MSWMSDLHIIAVEHGIELDAPDAIARALEICNREGE